MKFKNLTVLMGLLFVSKLAFAASGITIKMNLLNAENNNKNIGAIVAKETPYGLLLTPNLNSLTPGEHGFHVHVNPSCDKQGMDAGGHLDPEKTNKHLGPYDDKGHLGDLPVLIVDKEGSATLPVLAPRLKLQDLKNHSLMVHEGGDNYSDMPKLGGGGGRIACGIVN
jgi:Cu-Zn family superoxide dismutase